MHGASCTCVPGHGCGGGSFLRGRQNVAHLHERGGAASAVPSHIRPVWTVGSRAPGKGRLRRGANHVAHKRKGVDGGFAQPLGALGGGVIPPALLSGLLIWPVPAPTAAARAPWYNDPGLTVSRSPDLAAVQIAGHPSVAAHLSKLYGVLNGIDQVGGRRGDECML